MYKIEKNALLSDNKFVKYVKEIGNAKVKLTIRANINKKVVTAKLRLENAPFNNKVNFEILTFCMPLEENADYPLDLKFSFENKFESADDDKYAIAYIYKAIDGIADIFKRWVASDGIYMYLITDATKHQDILVNAQYKMLVDSGSIEEGLSETEAKKLIREALSERYVYQASTYPELEPILALSEKLTSKTKEN